MSRANRIELESLDQEISLHKISVADASSHPRYSAMMKKKSSRPVANL